MIKQDEGAADDEPFLRRSQGPDQLDVGREVTYSDEETSNSCGDIALKEIVSHNQESKDGDSDSANSDLPQCRICLEIGGDDFIAPCRCRGTQKFVHRACLDNWRAAKVVASLGLLVYTYYGEELREMFGYEEHPYGFYALAVIVIFLVGLLYGFFIAIICGQKISNRHYHILAKQELTKEYVVENLNADEAPAALDTGHIRELRMLGLY